MGLPVADQDDTLKAQIATISGSIGKNEVVMKRLKTLEEIRNKNGKKLKAKTTPTRKFRALAQVIHAWFCLRKFTSKNIWKIKQEQLTLFKHDYNVHIELVKSWLISGIRPVILSIFSQPDMSLDISEYGIISAEIQGRIVRLQVRVKGILEALVNGADNTQKFVEIVRFLIRMTSNGKYLPDDYLWKFEKTIIEFDTNGKILYFCLLNNLKKEI